MAKLNVVQVLNQLVEESVNPNSIVKELHPYYGLKDSKGWLTRYPVEDDMLPAQWVAEYVNAGGNLDSEGCWGVSPYANGYNRMNPSVTGSMAARLISEAHMNRWDNVPMIWNEEVVYSEDISLQDMQRICTGFYTRQHLAHYGIETSHSLISLGWKDDAWFERTVARHFSFSNPTHIEWGKGIMSRLQEWEEADVRDMHPDTIWEYENMSFPSEGSADWIKFQSDWTGREAVSTSTNHQHVKIQTRFGLEYSLRNSWRVTGNLLCMNRWGVSTTQGHLYLTQNHLCKGDVGTAAQRDAGFVEGITQTFRIRQIGEYNVCKVNSTCFAWEVGRSLDTHIEGDTMREAIGKLISRKIKADEMSAILDEGRLTLRQFHNYTSSCFPGTLNFLWGHAPHIARFVDDYSSWSEVMNSDLADVEWNLTKEFMASIKHRF